jgi:tetratricopeptide (TPR) repeat protein
MWHLKARLSAGFLFLGILLSGCASFAPQAYELKEQRPADLPPSAELSTVPFFPQDDYYCGPAALAMALNAAGIKATPDSLVDQVYLPGRKGSLQVEMLAATRRHGLIAYELEPKLVDLLREVAAGTPVVALENYGFSWYPVWHYSVMVGYDLESEEAIRRSGLKERQPMPLGVFEYLWKKDGRWAMLALPPDRVPVTATENRYAAAVAALERSGQPKNALIAYNAMLKRWPSSLVGLMGRGNTAYALKDLETAEAAFRQAAADHPDSAAALNNMAEVLAERGKLDEALATAQHAVSLGGPLLPTTQATLGEIRRKVELERNKSN